MSTLFELVARANALEQELIESGGEITAIHERIEEDLKTDIMAKSQDYYFVLERIKSNSEFYKKEAEKYSRVAKSLDATETRIKELLKMGLLSMGVNEVLGDTVKIVLSKTKERLIINDESIIPPKYQTVETIISINKDSIREDLAKGEPVDGAYLEGGTSIRFYPNRERAKK